MVIKIADENDLENIFELNRLFKNETTIEEMTDHINKNINEIICIAYLNDIAVGYCVGLIIKSICNKNCRLDIEALFVKEEYRQNGIGKELLKFIEKEAFKKNIFHFHIIAGNDKAVKFYENIGYVKTEEIFLDKTISV